MSKGCEPAYPVVVPATSDNRALMFTGLTKREHMALELMVVAFRSSPYINPAFDDMAARAVAYADALIAALGKGE